MQQQQQQGQQGQQPQITITTASSPPRGAPYSQHDLSASTSSLFQYRPNLRSPSSSLSPGPGPLPSPSPRSPLPSPSPRLSPQHVLRFTNCRLVRGHALLHDDLWVQDGRVVDPAKRFWEASVLNEFAADATVDCRGLIVAPGYIDVQINGAFGVDFTAPGWGVEAGVRGERKEGGMGAGKDAEVDGEVVERGLTTVAVGLLRHGVTAFCPTVITSSPETYAALLPHYRPRKGSPALGAHVLGVHCEGPFITKKGAHTARLMQMTAVRETAFEDMYGLDGFPHIRIITAAPEIDGMLDALAYTKRRHPSIVLSSGHSSASFDVAYAATQHGVTLLTHLFNAMVPFTHRDPGIIGLIGSNDARLNASLHYSLITDDIHTHHASVKIAYNSHPDGIVVITDAMAAMGLETGRQYHIGESAVTIVEGKAGRRRAVLSGTEVLAGSVATMSDCVKEMRRATGCSVVEASEAGSLHAAQVLGLKEKGRLDVGCDADVILLDDDMNVVGVWIAGQMAWVTQGAVTITDESE